MAKISFASKLQQTVPAVTTTTQAPKTEEPKKVVIEAKVEPKPAAPATAAAPVAQTTQAVTVRPVSNQLEGDFTSRDIQIPYLSLGQPTSAFTPDNPTWMGKWVFDKVACLGDTVRVVVCRVSKRLEEKVEYNSGDIPRRYDTYGEARKEGVVVQEVANIDLVIEIDKQDLAEFGSFDLGEKSYLPARYTVRSSAYGASVRVLLKDLAGWLNQDFSSGYYVIGSVKKQGKQNAYWVPSWKTDGKVSPELRALIAEKFNN